MADFIGTGFPQFSCALVQIRYSIEENGYGHILRGGGLWREDGERKEKRKNKEERRNGGGGYVKGNSRTGRITNKKNI